MSNDTPDLNRRSFEAETWAYYQGLKAKGWSHPLEGDTSDPEALFWRTPQGKYGVHQIEAAWGGWNLCLKTEGSAIENVLKRFEPLVQAALALIAEVDRRFDQEQPPLKYTIPYGNVNTLRKSLGTAERPVPEVFMRSADVQIAICQCDSFNSEACAEGAREPKPDCIHRR